MKVLVTRGTSLRSFWEAPLSLRSLHKVDESQSPLSPVVYFMEGRDSMQLIYRWTKSLDPNLKRGSWAPEEDAVSLALRENCTQEVYLAVHSTVICHS